MTKSRAVCLARLLLRSAEGKAKEEELFLLHFIQERGGRMYILL